MKDGNMQLTIEPTISNASNGITEGPYFDARLSSKMKASAGVTNETQAAHNPIIDAIKAAHQEHLSMLEDALYVIDDILGKCGK